jgi:hypothetical protein
MNVEEMMLLALERTSPAELAWAAGFFEGEGCVYVDERDDLAQPRLRLCLAQRNNRGLVELFRARVGGLGGITGPGVKNVDQWAVQGIGAHVVMELLSPYLTPGGPKIVRYEQALAQGCTPDKLNGWATGARR